MLYLLRAKGCGEGSRHWPQPWFWFRAIYPRERCAERHCRHEQCRVRILLVPLIGSRVWSEALTCLAHIALDLTAGRFASTKRLTMVLAEVMEAAVVVAPGTAEEDMERLCHTASLRVVTPWEHLRCTRSPTVEAMRRRSQDMECRLKVCGWKLVLHFKKGH